MLLCCVLGLAERLIFLRILVVKMMLLCGILYSILFHEAYSRLITRQCPSFDGIVLILGKRH